MHCRLKDPEHQAKKLELKDKEEASTTWFLNQLSLRSEVVVLHRKLEMSLWRKRRRARYIVNCEKNKHIPQTKGKTKY